MKIKYIPLACAALCACSSMRVNPQDPAARTRREIAALERAVEAYKAATTEYPADLRQLVTGPARAQNWKPLVGEEQLMDAWGTPCRINTYPEQQALKTGARYRIMSAGPDKTFGTKDDICAPETRPAADAYNMLDEKDGTEPNKLLNPESGK